MLKLNNDEAIDYFKKKRNMQDYLAYAEYASLCNVYVPYDINIPIEFFNDEYFIETYLNYYKNFNYIPHDYLFKNTKKDVVVNFVINKNFLKYAYLFDKEYFQPFIKTKEDCKKFLEANPFRNDFVIPDNLISEELYFYLMDFSIDIIDLIDINTITKKILLKNVEFGLSKVIYNEEILKKFDLFNEQYFNLLQKNKKIKIYSLTCIPVDFVSDDFLYDYLMIHGNLGNIPRALHSEKIIQAAVDISYKNLNFVVNQSKDLCFTAIEQSYKAFNFVKNPDDELRTFALLKLEDELL